MRNLFKYSRYYSGQEPQFIEGDIFRIIVPLNENYSFDYSVYDQTRIKPGFIAETNTKTSAKTGIQTDVNTSVKTSAIVGVKTSAITNAESGTKTSAIAGAAGDALAAVKLTKSEKAVLEVLRGDPMVTQEAVALKIGLTKYGVRYVIKSLKEKGMITRIGSSRNGIWKVKV